MKNWFFLSYQKFEGRYLQLQFLKVDNKEEDASIDRMFINAPMTTNNETKKC